MMLILRINLFRMLAQVAVLITIFLHSQATIVGYDIEEVLNTTIYSLLPSEQCHPDKLQTENVTYGALVLHAPEVDIQMSFCMFEASYMTTSIAHSARFDDATYITEFSRVIPTFYPLETWVCRSIWNKRSFRLPGFADNDYQMTEEDPLFQGAEFSPGDQKVFDYTYSFMRGGSTAGINFAWPIN